MSVLDQCDSSSQASKYCHKSCPTTGKLENLDDPVIRFFFTGGIYVTVSFLGVIGSPIAF